MKKIVFLGILGLIFSACHPNETSDHKGAQAQIANLMAAQVEAWDRGDLEGFMEPYLQTDSLLFVSKNGLRWGWQASLEAYQKNYGTPESRGRLVFENLHYHFLKPDLVLVAGKWTVVRADDQISGFYTLLWAKLDGKWVIISDHTS